ncbi:MAG: YceI family protein [Silicimonas sp.]|nr:YceI family protein [Silicimonas sp.]
MITRRTTLTGLGATLITCPALAAPVRYTLDREASRINFTYVLNGNGMKGKAVVDTADILLDVDRPSRSKVSAVIDMTQANAGIFFATEAMKGAQVLDTDRFPTIRFQSEKIEGTVEKATITGNLTIRDVTRTERFSAQLFRQQGTELGDRSRLSILMTGTIDRRLYGADGFLNFVGPNIGLEILTRITRA